MNDQQIAAIARNLAVALRDLAYTRKEEDKKRVSALQTELCAAVRQEEVETASQKETK